MPQIAIIGLGRFGSTLAKALHQMGHNVLGIDKDQRLVEEHRGAVTYPVRADATSESVLRELGIPNYDMVVVAIGTDMTANLMAVVLLLNLGVKEDRIIARAENQIHADTLRRMGIWRVVLPEQEMGARLAHTLFLPSMPDYISLTATYGVGLMRPPPGYADKTLRELGLGGGRDKYKSTVIALRRGRNVILSPDEDERLQEGDYLMLAGNDADLERLMSAIAGEALKALPRPLP
ncbi:MAG: TrkA family potassium uptake protein [Dehalococcoidia bacterium]|nr:TrkA family potassium uptake protein [Dehalococcoidia bacterium]